jgi:tetratricopeptide (TPR) repeat protein
VISILRFGLLRISLTILLTICAAWTVRSQITGGINETTSSNWGGNNYISGIVFFPDGTRVNTRIPIRLQSLTKGEILSMTDDSGKFIFSRVTVGTYRVIIDGDKDFESVSQDVQIDQAGNSPGQTFSLSLRLRFKEKSEMKPPGVIQSENADVPKKALDLYNKGVKSARSDDVKEAVEQLKLAVAEYPKFVSALNELGVLYMRLNELEKAEESLRLALKIKPDAFEPLINRGIVLFRLKRFEDAEPVLRSALTINGKVAVGHYYLGRLLTNFNRYDEAEKEFQLAIKLGGNEMNEAHRMLANMYLANDDYKRAADELEIYLRLTPKASDAEHLRQVLAQLKSVKPPATVPDQKPK